MRGFPLQLTKHQATGNDFLVAVDLEGARKIDGDEARALCDRRRGLGADGILRLTLPGQASGGADLVMELRNADGSEAEMSGNGIRCLVQAAVEAGAVAPGEVCVATASGPRRVTYEVRGKASGYATVDMGPVLLGEELRIVAAGVVRTRRVQVGNPHVVLLMDDVSDEVVDGMGPRVCNSVEGGVNVEFVSPPVTPGSLSVRVWERGVGETLSCGTGACAAAAACLDWGAVGPDVEVVVAGGRLEVGIRGSQATLGGPTRKVADIVVDEAELEGMLEDLSAPGGRPSPVHTRTLGESGTGLPARSVGGS